MKDTYGWIKNNSGFGDPRLVEAALCNLMPEYPIMEVIWVVTEGILVLLR